MNLARSLARAGALVLLPIIQPVMLGGAVATLLSAAKQQPAAAENAESIAKVAQAITVRIEGATQGSGVLVKREGNRYTVLTAWHVVSGHRPGEELDVFTPDGRPHRLLENSFTRFSYRSCTQTERGVCVQEGMTASADIVAVSFVSKNEYKTVALHKYSVGDSCAFTQDCSLYVAGFPSTKSSNITLGTGVLIGYGYTGTNQGYDLVYSAPTQQGMSGGPILDAEGFLIGIHGRGEKKGDSQINQGSILLDF